MYLSDRTKTLSNRRQARLVLTADADDVRCRCGLLAAGTTAGSITVFKYTPPPKDGDPVIDFGKCWEVQPSFQVREVHLPMAPVCL